MNLSDKELLLLNSFMYSDLAPKNKNRTLEEIISSFCGADGKVDPDKLSKAGVQLSGNINSEQMADIMNQMLEDPKICSLKITHTTDEYKGSIRGACFVDDEGNATVAFRGTGGSFEQWYGNTEAYGDEYNKSQEAAAEFINSLPYDDIEVTGHSNGANMAMFVTIVCGDKVKECKSFEGEGFSKEFVEKYKEQIKKNKHKITQISAHNDPIHRILKRIAGEEKYVNGSDGDFSHGCYDILKNNEFDENGDFDPSCYREESDSWKFVDLTNELANWSDIVIVGSILECVADYLGIVLGLLFDFRDINAWIKATEKALKSYEEMKINLAKDVAKIAQNVISGLKNAINNFKQWLFQQMSGYEYANENPYIEINTTTMSAYASRLRTLYDRSRKLDGKMNSLYAHAGFDWNAFSAVSNMGKLLKANVILDFAGRLNKCANYLNDTANEFDKVEKEIANSI